MGSKVVAARVSALAASHEGKQLIAVGCDAVTTRVAICRLAKLQAHLRQHGRPFVLPWCGVFVRGRRAQNGGVVALPTDDLQANWEAIFGKPGRNAGGRLTGQVELIGEGDPLEWASLLALDRFRTLDALFERRARDRRC